jgi:hypothetical protein
MRRRVGLGYSCHRSMFREYEWAWAWVKVTALAMGWAMDLVRPVLRDARLYALAADKHLPTGNLQMRDNLAVESCSSSNWLN